MNKKMLSILIIKMNIFFKSLFNIIYKQLLLDYIIYPVRKRGRRSIEKCDEEQKSEQSSDQNHCYSATPSRNKNE